MCYIYMKQNDISGAIVTCVLKYFTTNLFHVFLKYSRYDTRDNKTIGIRMKFSLIFSKIIKNMKNNKNQQFHF